MASAPRTCFTLIRDYAASPPLSAPLEISFDYTRSLGPVLSQFMAGLAQRQIIGSRGADGRVHVPPAEYDPVTFASPRELVEVGPDGTVLTWSWQPEPREGQPLGPPVRLGADQAGRRRHRAAARGGRGRGRQMQTGMRVRPRWADSPAGHITDIVCFEPAGEDGPSDGRHRPVDDPVPVDGYRGGRRA